MSWLFFLILIQHEYKEAKLAKVTKVSMEFAINNPQIATKKGRHICKPFKCYLLALTNFLNGGQQQKICGLLEVTLDFHCMPTEGCA